MKKVSLLQCHEYSHELLKEKIVKGLKDIGFDVQAFHKKRGAAVRN
jgi:hypothetical protein